MRAGQPRWCSLHCEDLPTRQIPAFAGGAILVMLADPMMPEAYEHGGKLVGLFTALGFAVAFFITSLE